MTVFIRLFVCLAACISSSALADELRPGYLEFTQQSQTEWRLVWKAPTTGGVTPQTRPRLPNGCNSTELSRENVLQAVVTRWSVECEGTVTGQRIGLANFEGNLTDVLVRITPLNRPTQATRLTGNEPTVEIVAVASNWQLAQSYLVLGVEHILLGFDHLCFVLALLLLVSGLRRLFWTITAFTLAHSVTLGLATLDVIRVPVPLVEALIALSIVFLAVEVVRKHQGQDSLTARKPWIVAFAFGLLHGLGFASALSEIGLPADAVPMTLLFFNIGVEAGQIAFVVTVLLSIELAKKLAPRALSDFPATQVAAYGIGGISAFWAIERVSGLIA